MFCPKLVKGGLGLVQLGQEPGEGAAAKLVGNCEAPPSRSAKGRGASPPSTLERACQGPCRPQHGGGRARAWAGVPASPLHGALTVQLVLVGALRQRLPDALQDAPPLDKRQPHVLLRDVQTCHPGRQPQTWPQVRDLEGSEGTTTTSARLVPREGVLGGTSMVSRRGRVTSLPGTGQEQQETGAPRVRSAPRGVGGSHEGCPWTGSGSGPPLTQSPQRVAALANPITFIRRPVCAVTTSQLSHLGPPPPPACSLGHRGCQLIRGPAGR